MAEFPKTVNEHGISVLFEPTDPTLDIIFVHGFTGSPDRTWTLKNAKSAHPTPQTIDQDDANSGAAMGHGSKRPRSGSLADGSFPNSRRPSKLPRFLPSSLLHRSGSSFESELATTRDVYWPRDLVPETLPNARVLTYGYDTHVRSRLAKPISKNKVSDHGWDLLCALGDIRRENPLRPLLFVCHSLGGLVSKVALIRSSDCRTDKPHLFNVIESTIGVFFFGTPHRGADPLGMARGVLTTLAKATSLQVNEHIVSTLLPGGDDPRYLHNTFLALTLQRQWVIFSFQEEYGPSGLFGNKVVDDESSRLGDPRLETTRHIAKDHMEMVRFSSLADPEYQKVAGALRMVNDKVKARQVVPVEHETDESTQLSGTTMALSATTSFSAPTPLRKSEAIPESHKELMNLLYFDELDARMVNLRSAHRNTCSWFLDKIEYKNWASFRNYDEHHGFLWIKGKPGAGKSILMKFLETKTRGSFKSPNQVVASFFFSAQGQLLEKSTIGLYRALLWQLFDKFPDLCSVLDSLGSGVRRFTRQSGWRIEVLKEVLEKLIMSLGKRELCLFVDALDECDDEDVADMVSFFEDIGDHAAEENIRLRICFSSRYYPTIMLKTGIEVKLDHEAEHNGDITRYIKAKLHVPRSSSKQAEELREQVLQKSAGIFLWVFLVIPMLNKADAGGRPEQLQKHLREIPPTLDNLFEMILTRDQENSDELRSSIRWILFAEPSLTLAEYYFALRDARNSESLGDWASEGPTDDVMQAFLQSSSKGLAEMTKSTNKKKSPTVRFIHESVRDYLLLKQGKQRLWPPTITGNFEGMSHDHLKARCLSEIEACHVELLRSRSVADMQDQGDREYLDAMDFVSEDESSAAVMESVDEAGVEQDSTRGGSDSPTSTLEKLARARPFLKYATLAILSHADLAQQHDVPQIAFIVNTFPRLKQTWVSLYEWFETRKYSRFKPAVSIIYILADLGRHHLLSVHPKLPRHGSPGHFGEGRCFLPLGAAVIHRQKEAARVLVAALSQEPGLADGIEEAVASFPYRPTRTVKNFNAFWDLLLMLNHPKLLGYYIKNHRSQFVAWCDGQFFTGVKSKEIASLLLESVIDLCWSPNSYGSPPRIASLIPHGADPNLQVRQDYRPLHWIVRGLEQHGSGTNDEVLRWQLLGLLGGGADINARDKLGRAPLHYAKSPGVIASLVGKDKFVKVYDPSTGIGSTAERPIDLRKSPTDVNVVDNDGKSPLFFAVSEDHASSLLDHGADPNLSDNNGDTPLHLATSAQHALVLIDRGADVDACNKLGRTPLFCKHDAVAMQLIKSAVNVDTVDHCGMTPLFIHSSHLVVRELLRANADVNILDNHGRTPLFTKKQYSALLALIEHGADVNARDNSGQTPLHLHCQNTTSFRSGDSGVPPALVKVATILINCGADVCAKDLEGKTPLDLVADDGIKKELFRIYEERSTNPLPRSLIIEQLWDLIRNKW